MSDQEVKVNFKTTADDRGAKQTARSIAAIERELKDARRAFKDATQGSEEFTRSANRLSTLNRELNTVTRSVQGLGRRGNAGGAVLEFSRAFEDAQYGIRGVLNNIPGLVAMLGGGAGLAGAISLAAVAGTQLWSRLGGGAETSKQALSEYKKALEEVTEKFKEQRDAEDEARRQAGKADAQTLKEALEGSGDTKGAADFQARIRFAREQAEQMLELTQLRVKAENLSWLTTNSSGKDAVGYAKQLQAIVDDIYNKEKEMAEAKRQAALQQARTGLLKASADLSSTEQAMYGGQDQIAGLQGQQAAARATYQEMRKARLGKRNELQEKYDSINAQLEAQQANPTYSMYGGDQRLVGEGMALKKQIEKLNAVPLDEAKAKAEMESFNESIKKASETLESLTEAAREAQREFEQAATAVERLKTEQSNQRSAEAMSQLGELDQKAAAGVRGALGTLGQMDGLSPRDAMQVEAATAGLESVLSDNLGDGGQAGSVAGRLQILKNGMQTASQEQMDALTELISGFRTISNSHNRIMDEIKDIKSTIKQEN